MLNKSGTTFILTFLSVTFFFFLFILLYLAVSFIISLFPYSYYTSQCNPLIIGEVDNIVLNLTAIHCPTEFLWAIYHRSVHESCSAIDSFR
jgi:hypothetical protein